MSKQELSTLLADAEAYFERSTRCLTEADSGFQPVAGMYTAAQQVLHAAQTIEWFVEGATTQFDLDFGKHDTEVRKADSLTSARERLAKAFASAREFIASQSEDALNAPLPPGPIMGGAPRSAIFAAITDHTAHHRGALTVYSRLLGKTPIMPYME